MKKVILYTVLVVTVVAALGAVGRMDVEAEKQEQQIQYLREQQMKLEGRQLKEDRAYSICTEAHAEVSGSSEEACGEALDAAGKTFQCAYPNTAESNCWLAEKE